MTKLLQHSPADGHLGRIEISARYGNWQRSVERSGLFGPIAERVGAIELTTVRRQREKWQRKASEAFSRAGMATGLRAYADRDRLKWSESITTARRDLVADYLAAARSRPEASRFAFAATYDQADALNADIRDARFLAGELPLGHKFQTRKRQRSIRTTVSVGDRIQFFANDRKIGFLNGELATVQAVTVQNGKSPQLMTVRKDDGNRLTFDPVANDEWGLGYAGTIYKTSGQDADMDLALEELARVQTCSGIVAQESQMAYESSSMGSKFLSGSMTSMTLRSPTPLRLPSRAITIS
jgi:ATP-dependent exoDNAse (exonuclease V) alpha subunit